MKHLLLIITVALVSLFCCEAYAQKVRTAITRQSLTSNLMETIQDASYRTIGHIKSDGTVQDASYRTVGHLKNDGTFQNRSYSTIGHIRDDGTVQDGNYRTIGHIKDDGTIQDANYRTIGHARGIPKAWAAWYFFF